MKKHYHKLILLVDSDRISNFFNKIIIKQTQIAEKVIALDNYFDALNFITPKETLYPVPEIIFMDLKTPQMNGWEFLEKYNQLDKNSQKSIIIIFTDDLLKEEEINLSQYPFVRSFMNKKLDHTMITEVNEQLLMNNKELKISNN